MIVLILMILSGILNAETFYLNSRKTEFYDYNVQINGNDITDKMKSTDKVVIDDYIIEGPNILNICYYQKTEAGKPNVKQLSKVELYNTKVNTHIRGLAHFTPKKLIPVYISVSPQFKNFDATKELCVTHNFQDYTQEQLAAMEKKFNSNNVVETQIAVTPDMPEKSLDMAPKNSNQAQQDTSIQSVQNPELQTQPQSEVAGLESQLNMITEEQNSAPDDALQATPTEVSSQEALEFIPDEDFVPPVQMQPQAEDSMAVNGNEQAQQQIMPTEQSVDSMPQDNQFMEANSENDNSAEMNAENMQASMPTEEDFTEPAFNDEEMAATTMPEAEPATAEGSVVKDEVLDPVEEARDVASEPESNLSDEEFFSELNIQSEESEAP